MNKNKNFMGIDQYGTTYHNLGAYPRKGLLKRLCRSNANKMYIDLKDGRTAHIGYIIAGLWIELYEINPFYKFN